MNTSLAALADRHDSSPESPVRRMLLRRLAVAGMAGAGAASSVDAWAHKSAGPVQPPLAAPAFQFTTHDGVKTDLNRFLRGRPTAMQLMFTGCSSTCPIQGAVFGATLARLPADSGVRLLSVSIDPLNDDPQRMRAWLARHGGNALWTGATPSFREIDQWFDFLRARVSGNDRHTAQVYFFDAQARLVLRSTDFPRPEDIARMLLQLATFS